MTVNIAMPLVWRTLSNHKFDVVISSSHAFAHTVKLGDPADTRHLSYIHSPARYVWSPDFDGRGSHPALKVPRKVLQKADPKSARLLIENNVGAVRNNTSHFARAVIDEEGAAVDLVQNGRRARATAA